MTSKYNLQDEVMLPSEKNDDANECDHRLGYPTRMKTKPKGDAFLIGWVCQVSRER
jgi:hypothetical protein